MAWVLAPRRTPFRIAFSRCRIDHGEALLVGLETFKTRLRPLTKSSLASSAMAAFWGESGSMTWAGFAGKSLSKAARNGFVEDGRTGALRGAGGDGRGDALRNGLLKLRFREREGASSRRQRANKRGRSNAETNDGGRGKTRLAYLRKAQEEPCCTMEQ